MKNIYLFLLVFLIPSTFLLAQTRVYPPELSAPENGDVNQMPDVELDWHAVTGDNLEIFYEVQISEDASFTNPVDFPLTNLTAINASELMFGDTYFWRVRAHDGDNVSDWSEVWSFEVLKTVEINKPTDGSEVNPQVDLEWDEVVGATSYQILVDTLYTWKKETTPFDKYVRSVVVLSNTVFGGVGDDGLIFHKEGNTWSVDESGTTKDLLGVCFPTESIGWAVGKSGTVLHFDGSSWSAVDIGTTKDLLGVYFLNENDGWIVGKSGKVFHYDGSAWTEMNIGTTKDLYTVWALSADNVWVAGKSGTFGHYNGTDWTVDTPGSKDYQSMWFNNENDGWAVAKSGRYAHWDGTSWAEENIGVSKTLYGVAFKSENEGYIVGQSGNLFQYNGNEWIKVTSGTVNDIYAIWFNGDNGVYAGKYGDVFTYTGGGFNSPFAKIYNVSGDAVSYYLDNLIFGATYYYKMRAEHTKDTSEWSLARSFYVQPAPELLSPSNGSSGEQLKVDLKWKEFEGVLKYNISISDNPDFSNAFNSSSDSTSYLVTGLTFGKTYYWRVNAQHALATSPWSDPWAFTTVNTVNLVSPADGATGVDPCPMVKWELIDGVPNYEVWLDTTNTFETPLIRVESSDHSQCQKPLLKGKTYYWKVRGIVALDTSDFSPTWSFTTESAAGIEEDQINSSLSVYPNPSNGHFVVNFETLKPADFTVKVYDVVGKVVYKSVYRTKNGLNKLNISLNDLPQGVYYLEINGGDNVSVSRKVSIK
jgi:photosystem II stability/assembly factor-like uncharacterized protein